VAGFADREQVGIVFGAMTPGALGVTFQDEVLVLTLVGFLVSSTRG
jgi:hypothetical protein